jgi:phenylpyruvate tautomerase PptA (4-oxalocrotonate tautomerase family)
VPLIQISIYPKRIVEQKEHFAKSLTKDAAIEILKAKLQQQHAIRKSYYQSL